MNSTEKINQFNEAYASLDKNSTARKRMELLFDEGSFVELNEMMMSGNEVAAVVAGYGMVEGAIVYAFSQDFSINSGAITSSHANKIRKVYEFASKMGCPIVSIFDSNGAKLEEGNEMLNSYSQMLMWSNNISGVVPQIALVLGTCAGASAMIAASADILVMSKKSQIFMTAPFITMANGDNNLDAGTAKAAAESGLASIIGENDSDCIDKVRKLLPMLPSNNLSPAPIFDFESDIQQIEPQGCSKVLAQTIADKDSTILLNQDYGNGANTFLGTMAGVTTGFISTSKGRPIDSNSCDKVARFVKFCDAFNIPIVSFINTNGFAISSDVSIVRSAAKMASSFAEATVPKISVITGKAFGTTYLTLGSKNANADVTIAWPMAQISSLAPETAVEFLWADKFIGITDLEKTREKLVSEYIYNVASPINAAKQGYIDSIILPENTRATLIGLLDMLSSKRETKQPKKHTTI